MLRGKCIALIQLKELNMHILKLVKEQQNKFFHQKQKQNKTNKNTELQFKFHILQKN